MAKAEETLKKKIEEYGEVVLKTSVFLEKDLKHSLNFYDP